MENMWERSRKRALSREGGEELIYTVAVILLSLYHRIQVHTNQCIPPYSLS